MDKRKKVCFVSDNNTCRSIIAEVSLRHLARQYFEVQSFGLKADRVHYLVANVLQSRDLNPNYSFSKVYEVVENQKFDIIVLMHPSLKEKLPRIDYDHELLVWDFEAIALSADDEDRHRKALESLCDAIVKQVKTFVEKYK